MARMAYISVREISLRKASNMNKVAPADDGQAPSVAGARHPVFNVRGFAGTDAAGVLRINSEGYPGVARLDESELHRLWALPNYHLVAEDLNGLLVGYCLAFPWEAAYDGEEFQEFRRLAPKPFLYIDQVAVAKESKSLGVGRMMYDTLEALGRRDRAQALCCEVNNDPPNPGSMAFHQALGFRRVRSLATSDGRKVELLLKPVA